MLAVIALKLSKYPQRNCELLLNMLCDSMLAIIEFSLCTLLLIMSNVVQDVLHCTLDYVAVFLRYCFNMVQYRSLLSVSNVVILILVLI